MKTQNLASLMRSPSLWVGLVGMLLAIFPVVANRFSDYQEAQIADGAFVLPVVCPAVAAAAAWEASRFRYFAESGWNYVRKIYADRILPLSIFVPAAYLLGVLVLSLDLRVMLDGKFWLLIGLCASCGILWAGLGGLFGFTIRPVFAIPLSAVLPFVWHAVLTAREPGVVPLLGGRFFGCCADAYELDPSTAVVALLGVLFVTALGASMVVWRLRNVLLSAISVCVAVAALSAGVHLAKTLDPSGVRVRSDSELMCDGIVCYWPETPVEYIERNSEAYLHFRRLAPREWSNLGDGPLVVNGDTSQRLQFGYRENVDATLGVLVEQAYLLDAARSHRKLCGVLAADLAPRNAWISWPKDKMISIEEVHALMEARMCPVDGLTP